MKASTHPWSPAEVSLAAGALFLAPGKRDYAERVSAFQEVALSVPQPHTIAFQPTGLVRASTTA